MPFNKIEDAARAALQPNQRLISVSASRDANTKKYRTTIQYREDGKVWVADLIVLGDEVSLKNVHLSTAEAHNGNGKKAKV